MKQEGLPIFAEVVYESLGIWHVMVFVSLLNLRPGMDWEGRECHGLVYIGGVYCCGPRLVQQCGMKARSQDFSWEM